MYQCKDFYDLNILSLYEGDLLGKVDKLFFDKKIKKLCEMELVGTDGAKLTLPIKNIYHVGKNAITVKNNQAVMLKNTHEEYCLAPIGSKVFSITGEFLGVVNEIIFNEKFLSEKLLLDNGEIMDINNMASCGKNSVIFYCSDKKISLKSFTPNEQPKEFKGDYVKTETMPIKEVEQKKIQTKTQVLLQNTNFLLGRTCTKDIFNFNNELLIKAHSVVNKKNLKEISKFGKLRELMLYSQ